MFTLSGNQWLLVSIDMNRNISLPPRGVGVGNMESEITAAYKDFGMPDNQDGSRNLYYADPLIGVVLNNGDGTHTVQYTAVTLTNEVLILQFYIDAQGACTRIVNYVRK